METQDSAMLSALSRSGGPVIGAPTIKAGAEVETVRLVWAQDPNVS